MTSCAQINSQNHMGSLRFLLFGLLFSVVYADNECSASFCSNYSFPIRFPFQLMAQVQQPQNCGYPGFNLSCTDQGMLILSLPYSGDFFVREINYLTREIQLYDPQGCLPGRLLKLNLSSSPFVASYYKNYTFLGCPPEFVHVRSSFTVIDCLSNSTISILATSSAALARAMNTCSMIATIPIPRVWSPQYGDGFSSDLNNGDLFLSWNIPGCKICEDKGGTCEMGSNASQDILCSVVPAPGKGRQQGILRVIGFAIFLPFVVLPALVIGILCCKCILAGEQNRAEASLRLYNITAAATIPQFTNRTRGLDDSIIQSYPKVILDESRNLPGDIDLICPICLADYHPGEALRCIPKCEHYFHADCINEWLRLRSTCPVCRTAPSDVAQNP